MEGEACFVSKTEFYALLLWGVQNSEMRRANGGPTSCRELGKAGRGKLLLSGYTAFPQYMVVSEAYSRHGLHSENSDEGTSQVMQISSQ